MDRKFLEGLGLEKEAIDKVMAEHGKAVQAAKPEDYEDLKKEKESLESQVEKLNGTLKDTNDKYDAQTTTLEELQTKANNAESENMKIRIANQAGLPFDLAGRLTGETEDEIKADAEKFATFVNKPTPAPLKPTENSENDKYEPYKNMLNNINKKGE